MRRLGGFVKKTVKSLNAEKAIKLHQLKSAWLTAVGPFMGSQTEPVKIKYDTLFLVVASPMWAQEIKLQQKLILNQLRKSVPQKLTKIVCWVGDPHAKRSAPLPTDQESDEQESVPWKNREVPAERAERIEQTLSTVQDSATREKLRKLLTLSVRRELYLLDQGQLPCPVCGNFRPAELELCEQCQRERREEEERTVFRLLARKPWLTARDVAERTAVKDRATFMRIRKQLLADLMLQAWQRTDGKEGEELAEMIDAGLRSLFLDITMLRCSLSVHKLSPKHFYHALGKRLAKAYLEGD